MPSTTLRSAPLVLAALAAAAVAQHPLALPSPVAVAAAATSVQPSAGGAVARGADWRATITATATTFVPALGERAPRERPFTLVWLPDAEPGAPRLRAGGVDVPAGGAVLRHDARADGLEVAVLFAAHPQGRGELVARFRVVTDLPFAGSTGDGLAWRDGGLGGVTLGAVTGLDAAGRSVRGDARLVGDVLELALPARFVDEARWPVLLDPLLGTAIGVLPLQNDTQPDVAWEPVSQRYGVVWRSTFASGSSEIRAAQVTPQGNVLGPLVTAAVAGARNLAPTIAAAGGRFYVAWQTGAGPLGPFAIDVTSFDPSGATDAPLQVSSPSWSCTQPRLCFDAQSGLVHLSCLDSADFVDRWSIYRTPGGAVAATTLQGVSAPGVERLAVARYAQNGAEHIVLVHPFGSSSTVTLIRFAGYWYQGSLAMPLPNGVRAGDVAIDLVDDAHGVIAWAQEEVPGGLVMDVWARPFHFDGTQLGFDGPAAPLAAVPGVHEAAPAIAALGAKYSIAWVAETGSGDTAVRGAEFTPGCAICSTSWSVDGAAMLAARPAFAARRAGDVPQGEALLVLTETPLAAPFSGSTFAQRIVLGGGGSIVEAGQGCGFAGTFDTVGGPFALGNTAFALRLQNFPAGALTFSSLGFPGGEVVCGVCAFTNGIAIQYVAPSSPTEVVRPLPMPCDPSFFGITLSAQWLVFGGSGAPCPAAAGLLGSRRLHLTLGDG